MHKDRDAAVSSRVCDQVATNERWMLTAIQDVFDALIFFRPGLDDLEVFRAAT
jgi:hypothetical protein